MSEKRDWEKYRVSKTCRKYFYHESIGSSQTSSLSDIVIKYRNCRYNKKAVRLMAQLIKFYKFYYLLYLNKRWLNSQ